MPRTVRAWTRPRPRRRRRAGPGAASRRSALLRRRPSPPSAAATRTEWWWPPSPTIFRTIPAGFLSFEHLLVPEIDPSPTPYAWGHEFSFVGGGSGWLGLRSGDGAGGGDKAAVFVVRGAVGATGHGATATAGPEPGWACTLPCPWEAGRTYRLRVRTEADGWWSGEVADEGGGGPVLIGRAQVPGGWRRLASRSVSWTEYRGGPLADCADLAPSQVTFSVPTADGAVLPLRHENLLGPGTCPGSEIDDLGGGVRHRMGRRA
ncbi:MAG: hypothetical protein ABR511_05315 [Acidimicrobiales bacterium]